MFTCKLMMTSKKNQIKSTLLISASTLLIIASFETEKVANYYDNDDVEENKETVIGICEY